jgi:hypothetical protein
MNDAQRDLLLGRLDGRTEAILKRLENGDQCIKDHEKRIGNLESFQNILLAFAGAISLAVSVFGTWVLSQFRGS